MKHRHYSDEEKFKLITECRQSGLSDHQWCLANNIPNSTFYRWISNLRKSACEIPALPDKSEFHYPRQEVVKVDIVKEDLTITPTTIPASSAATVELELNGCKIKIQNNATKEVIMNVMSALRGALC